jgi:3',5'-cyclic AMP phosphodiesterase CpdA
MWRSFLAVVVALLAVTSVVGWSYRRQVVSYLTHWKGSPTHTQPLEALPAGYELHLAVAGDVGDSGARFVRTSAAMAQLGADEPFDAVLLLGDNVYPDGDPAQLDEAVFEPLAPVLAEGPDLLAILGNHDVKKGHGDAQMAALGMPGRWWSRVYGDVLIVGLDSNDPWNVEQRAWLEDTLSRSTATWRIVALHHPPYSAGYQGSDLDARRSFAPLFETYGVQLVLSGHDHDYQRSIPQDGVTYVVSGAAAGTRRTGEKSFTAESFSWHHFVDVTVYPDRLVLRAINQDLRVADEVVLQTAGWSA